MILSAGRPWHKYNCRGIGKWSRDLRLFLNFMGPLSPLLSPRLSRTETAAYLVSSIWSISLSLFYVSPYSHLNIVVISLSPFRLTSLCASPTSVFLVYSMQGQLFRPRDLRGLPKGAADRRWRDIAAAALSESDQRITLSVSQAHLPLDS